MPVHVINAPSNNKNFYFAAAVVVLMCGLLVNDLLTEREKIPIFLIAIAWFAYRAYNYKTVVNTYLFYDDAIIVPDGSKTGLRIEHDRFESVEVSEQKVSLTLITGNKTKTVDYSPRDFDSQQGFEEFGVLLKKAIEKE